MGWFGIRFLFVYMVFIVLLVLLLIYRENNKVHRPNYLYDILY